MILLSFQGVVISLEKNDPASIIGCRSTIFNYFRPRSRSSWFIAALERLGRMPDTYPKNIGVHESGILNKRVDDDFTPGRRFFPYSSIPWH
jgi:hypothetical protein